MTAFTSFFIIIILIYLLSVITDDFFIPSLDRISTKWKIPENVAGASLMAMGTSAPELSIALFALFTASGAHSDIGIGTIVGSAVFNILVITGVCAMVRKAYISLPAVVRDTFFYLISIVLLFIFLLDGRITLTETGFFVFIYMVYLVVLFFFPMDDIKHSEVGGEEQKPAEAAVISPKPMLTRLFLEANRWVNTVLGKLAGDAEKSYYRAFSVSIFLIAGISYFLVEEAVILATALNVPGVIIGLTVLAAGTSAPDLISSVIVAKQGRGGMAVSNAVGSNIFDILIGLGVPWGLALLIFDLPSVSVNTKDLITSTILLFLSVVILFLFLYTGRMLSKKEGIFLLLLYAGYVLVTVYF